MIWFVEVECMFYEGKSLKQKRSIIKKIIAKLRNTLNVAVTELDYHDLWQRTKLGVVTISSSSVIAEQIIQDTLNVIDSFPEIERTITEVERI